VFYIDLTSKLVCTDSKIIAAENSTFSIPIRLLRQNSGSQDITIPVGFSKLVAKTPIYPVMCLFPSFVSLCDHNSPKLQTDGGTDGRHARSVNATRAKNGVLALVWCGSRVGFDVVYRRNCSQSVHHNRPPAADAAAAAAARCRD